MMTEDAPIKTLMLSANAGQDVIRLEIVRRHPTDPQCCIGQFREASGGVGVYDKARGIEDNEALLDHWKKIVRKY